MALQILPCANTNPHEPHKWTLHEGKYGRQDTLASCLGVDDPSAHGAHHDRSCVCWERREGCGCYKWDQDCPHFQQALVDDEVTLGQVKNSPEFDLAAWFSCLLLGHKWKWLVRLNWPDEDSPLTYGISPVAERCKRCGIRRDLNIFRWFEFVNGGPMWGAGPTP